MTGISTRQSEEISCKFQQMAHLFFLCTQITECCDAGGISSGMRASTLRPDCFKRPDLSWVKVRCVFHLARNLVAFISFNLLPRHNFTRTTGTALGKSSVSLESPPKPQKAPIKQAVIRSLSFAVQSYIRDPKLLAHRYRPEQRDLTVSREQFAF
jgi:hypothetical protein